MKYLVLCTCSHSLESHASEGCAGERSQGCACRLDQLGALNAAIDSARVDAATAWRKPGDAEGVEIA